MYWPWQETCMSKAHPCAAVLQLHWSECVMLCQKQIKLTWVKCMLQKRCHLKCFLSPRWSLESRLESSCVCRRESWTPAQGGSADAGGRTQQDGFVTEASVLWNCSWAAQNSCHPPGLGSSFLLLHLSSANCFPVAVLHVVCSRSPGQLSGWQQGHEKFQSLEVPFVGLSYLRSM